MACGHYQEIFDYVGKNVPIQSVSKYLSTYSVPGTVLGVRKQGMRQNPFPPRSYGSVEETDMKKTKGKIINLLKKIGA